MMTGPYAPDGLGWTRATMAASTGSNGATRSHPLTAAPVRIGPCKWDREVGVRCNRLSERGGEPSTEAWTYCPSRVGKQGASKHARQP